MNLILISTARKVIQCRFRWFPVNWTTFSAGKSFSHETWTALVCFRFSSWEVARLYTSTIPFHAWKKKVDVCTQLRSGAKKGEIRGNGSRGLKGSPYSAPKVPSRVIHTSRSAALLVISVDDLVLESKMFFYPCWKNIQKSSRNFCSYWTSEISITENQTLHVCEINNNNNFIYHLLFSFRPSRTH